MPQAIYALVSLESVDLSYKPHHFHHSVPFVPLVIGNTLPLPSPLTKDVFLCQMHKTKFLCDLVTPQLKSSFLQVSAKLNYCFKPKLSIYFVCFCVCHTLCSSFLSSCPLYYPLFFISYEPCFFCTATY